MTARIAVRDGKIAGACGPEQEKSYTDFLTQSTFQRYTLVMFNTLQEIGSFFHREFGTSVYTQYFTLSNK